MYLDEKLKANNNYNFCLDLIDHLSKYIYSYLLINKAMEIVVSKIKLFILSFGKCKIFQTDNGLEFKNKELIVFLSNEGIKLNRVFHDTHKQIDVWRITKIVRKALLNGYEVKKQLQ